MEGIEEIERAAQGILSGQSGDGRRIDVVDGRQGPGRLVVQSGKDGGKFLLPQDPSGDGLAFQPLDHQPSRRKSVGCPGGDHLRHGNPGSAGGLKHTHFRIDARMVDRPGPPQLLQNEWSRLSFRCLEVECAGDP